MADWDISVSEDDISDVNPDELKQMLEVRLVKKPPPAAEYVLTRVLAACFPL